MENMPHSAEAMKRAFCEGAWQGCARFRVFDELGLDAVPGDLFPDMNEEAEAILSDDRRARPL